MSPNNSQAGKIPEAAPDAAQPKIEGCLHEGGLTPRPVMEDELTSASAPDTAGYEQTAPEQKQKQPEAFQKQGGDTKSAFSDSSDEEDNAADDKPGADKPDDDNDLCSDDEEAVVPPRPKTPLAPSSDEQAMKNPAVGRPKTFDRCDFQWLNKDLNYFDRARADRRLHDTLGGGRQPYDSWEASRSSLSVVSLPGSDDSDKEEEGGQDGEGGQGGENAGQDGDELIDYYASAESESDEWSQSSSNDGDSKAPSDEHQAKRTVGAQSDVESEEASASSARSSQKHDPQNTESLESNEAPCGARPASPLASMYRREIGGMDSLDEEFRALAQQEDKAREQSAADSVANGDDASPPNSADLLEQITGIPLKDGERRFRRLMEFAEKPMMRNPAHALELQRQMLRFHADVEADRSLLSSPAGIARSHKIRSAWAWAAAHHYRHQREAARASSEMWRKDREGWRYSSQQWELWADEQKEIQAEKRQSWLDASQKYEARLMEAETDNDDLEFKLSIVRGELEALVARCENRETAEQATQTDFETCPESTTKDHVDAGTQTQATSSAVSEVSEGSESDEELILSDEEGTPSPPQRANRRMQRSRPAAPPLAPRRVRELPFGLSTSQRNSPLIPDMADWLNREHVKEGGDAKIRVTTQQIDAFLTGETSYLHFVSAVHGLGLQFRHTRLADWFRDYINDHNLGEEPLALLQYRHSATGGTVENIHSTMLSVYRELARRQVELNDAEFRLSRLVNTPSGEFEVQMRSAQADAASARNELQSVRQRLSESEETVSELTNNLVKSPSQKSESKASTKADVEKTTKLSNDLKSCRDETARLTQSLNDAGNEKEDIRKSLEEWRRYAQDMHEEKRLAANDAAHWKQKFEEMEAQCSRQFDETTRLQFKCGEMPEVLSDEEAKKTESEGNELTTLRAEIERLKADHERLNEDAERAQSDVTALETQITEQQQQIEHLKGEEERLRNVEHEASAADPAELRELKEKNRVLEEQNARYNIMLNNAVRLNEAAKAETHKAMRTNLTISTDLPLRSTPAPGTANLGTPAAIPLPVTAGLTTGVAPPTAASLLRPSDVRTPRSPLLPEPPVDATTMPSRWLERQRRYQNTRSFRQTRDKILQMLEQRDGVAEEARRLAEERGRLDSEIELSALRRAERIEQMRRLEIMVG